MQDQWGNEITVAQTGTQWVFTRSTDGCTVSYSYDMTHDQAAAKALISLNGMEPEDA